MSSDDCCYGRRQRKSISSAGIATAAHFLFRGWR